MRLDLCRRCGTETRLDKGSRNNVSTYVVNFLVCPNCGWKSDAQDIDLRKY